MDRAECIVITSGVSLMAVFFACLVYAARALHITIPFCNDSVNPFTVGEVIPKGNNHFEVHVLAKMWSFEPLEVRLPKGADVDLYVISQDVNHGFHVAGTNVNLMAVPGSVNGTHVVFKENGTYRVVCHEYCGAGHQGMSAKFVITDDPYQATAQVAADEAGLSDIEKQGKAIFTDKGCVACHSRDGSHGVGPTFTKLWGRHEDLEGGGGITVDDAYFRESVKQPTAKVVKGFQPVMPQLPVSDEELEKLIAYAKKL